MDEWRLMTLTDSPDHHGSHRDLLWQPEHSSAGQVDAIIVPTVRNPVHLETAKDLAAALDCTLVTLHSGKWTSAGAAAGKRRPDVRHIAIDVPDAARLRLIDFETTRLMTGPFARRTDTSVKRNLGLLLAHLAGWQRIVFLDDDISVSHPSDLSSAAGLLDTYNAVGLSIGGFPDNSVVCHAYRLIGGSQQTFIGGGALAVEITRNLSFFPDIYNEDWFYLLDPVKGLQPLAVTGQVIQQPYEPYREERARTEELGDVLAEGIFWLLDQERSLDEADARHWREFIKRRRRFIQHILDNIGSADVEPALRVRVIAVLKASLGRLAIIEPEWCEKYMKAWMADHAAWDHHIRSLHHIPSTEEAIHALSKKGRPPLKYVLNDGSAGQAARSFAGCTNR
jgi:hypothetical protein